MASLITGNCGTVAGLSVGIAASHLERQQALELHHDVYLRRGLLPHDRQASRPLTHGAVPGTVVFVAKEHETSVGTITVFSDSAIGLPIDDVHQDEVDAMRRRFARVAEVGRLAVVENRRGCGITMMLYEATFRWALGTGAQCLVACVNPSFRRVYSRLLLFDVLGGVKPHPRYRQAPSIPIGLDLTAAVVLARAPTLVQARRDYVARHVALPDLTTSPPHAAGNRVP